MSSVFRRTKKGPLEVSKAWVLDVQIDEISRWLGQTQNGELIRDTILDIGFNSRLCGKVAVQGETIPLPFMQRLVEHNVTLYLTIYPWFEEGADQD